MYLARRFISTDIHDEEEDEEMSEATHGDEVTVEKSNRGPTSDQQQNESQSAVVCQTQTVLL